MKAIHGVVLALVCVGATACGSPGPSGSGDRGAEEDLPPVVDTLSACDYETLNNPLQKDVEYMAWVGKEVGIVVTDDNAALVIHTDGSRVQSVLHGAKRRRASLGFFADFGKHGFAVYSSCDLGEHYEIVRMDTNRGTFRRLTQNTYFDHFPVWSPDETAIAFVAAPEDGRESFPLSGRQLFVMAAAGDNARAVAAAVGPVALVPPRWSPDGARIAFLVEDEGDMGEESGVLYSVGADGSGLWRVARVTGPASWSPSGDELAFGTSDGEDPGLYVSRFDGSGIRPVVTSLKGLGRGEVGHVAWSPNGEELLFVATEAVSGGARHSVHVVRTDGSRLRRLSSFSQLHGVAWSPDGARVAIYGGLGEGKGVVVSQSRLGGDVRELAHEVRIPVGVGYARRLVAAAPRSHSELPGTDSCSAGVLVPKPAEHPGLVSDCEALLAARGTLAGGATLLWGNGPISGWEGIAVAGSPPRVREVDLRGYTLTGTIPAALANLAELQRLDLSYNVLTGAIPPGLGSLAEIRELSFVRNVLTGVVPQELADLPNLRALGLEGNYFDCVPRELMAYVTVRRAPGAGLPLEQCQR